MSDGLPDVQRVEHFLADAQAMDDEQFLAKHGRAFLVHFGEIGEQLLRAARPQRTLAFRGEVTSANVVTPMRVLKANFLVYPVIWTGRSPYPRMITVGRTRNNDIILPDESVSKFHAFFRSATTAPHLPAGVMTVQDGGSRNGTFVDGAQVPNARTGGPVPIASGAQVRIGSIQLTFLDAPALRALAVKVA